MTTNSLRQKKPKQRNYPIAIYDGEKNGITEIEGTTGANFPIVAITPPTQVIQPNPIFPYIDTGKAKNPYKDVQGLLADFEFDLDQIRVLGEKIFEEDVFFQKREQARAVHALSKILGLYNKYFKDASESDYLTLMHTLRLKFQVGKNSKTTPFHLLSRQYRGNDTKQASSDAKILILANKLGKDENTFSTWIFECKGLREAQNLSNEHAKQERNLKRVGTPKKLSPKAIFDKLHDSFIDLIRAKQAHRVFTIKQEDMPDFFGAVKPWSGQSVGMIGVDITGDSMKFYQLLEYVPNFDPHKTEVPSKKDSESEE
nr:hypothetical protein [uncultured Duganella sp.]